MKLAMMAVVRIVIMQCMVSNMWAFNISPQGRVIVDPQRDPESYFGYTVALQSNPLRLVVGAPRSYNAEFWGTERPGAVYSCTYDLNYLCMPISLERYRSYDPAELKENSWIGGALDVSDIGSNLVVCGPRRKIEGTRYSREPYYIPGVCYSIGLSSSEKLLPMEFADYNYGYGQTGLSVHMTPSKDLVIGAPGTFGWMGTAIKYSSRGGLIRPNTLQNVNSGFDYYGYAGYSVTSGEFKRGQRFYVTSAPRLNQYRGLVFLFIFPNGDHRPLHIRATLNGTQMGEYFGATLAATDVNGDGIDDLLVGSPLYSTNSSGDMGAVYVYLSHQIWNNLPPLMLFGHWVTGARFGSAIGALADLDKDGFKDVAIGAPYEGSGAVYIYRGSPLGLSQHPSQRIAASSVASNLRGFGISISRGVDMDSNFYPDLAVGAYDSGHAILLYSRLVVHINTHISRNFKRLSVEGHTRFRFDICVTYSGKVPPAQLDVTTELTVDDVHHRAYVMESRELTFRLRLSAPTLCKTQMVALRPNDTWRDTRYYGRMPVFVRSRIASTMDVVPTPVSKLNDSFYVQIVPTCEKDVCVPTWRTEANFLNLIGPNGSYVLGSPETLRLHVTVFNEGDSAYLRDLVVILPEKLSLKILPSHCQGQALPSKYTCLSALRVPHGQKVEMELHLDTSTLDVAKIMELRFLALSYDSDDQAASSVFLNVIRISRFDVRGWPSPEVAVLPQPGPQRPSSLVLIHVYEVFCTGYSAIPSVQISVTVPKRIVFFRVWHTILSDVKLKAILGDDEVNCSLKESRKRGDLEEDFEAAERFTAVCEAGPLAPQSNTVILALTMHLDLEATDVMVGEEQPLLLNSSVSVEVVGDADAGAVAEAVGTLLVVPKLVREEPLLPIYIAVAVAVAIALLALSSYGLWKCGFFNRQKVPNGEKEKLGEGEPQPESDAVAVANDEPPFETGKPD